MDFDHLPRHFSLSRLHRSELNEDPKQQLLHWLQEAQGANVKDLNAMCLSTASKEGKPSSRMVLLKKIDAQGLIFFTNYGSRKSREIEENPHVAATLFWGELMRQIVIEGMAEQISTEESWDYFSKRPRGSRLAAWASPQDQVISSYEILEQNVKLLEKKYESRDIPLPPFWGGFRIVPSRYEFWQGGENRLHDRFQYVLENNRWKIERLAP